MSCWASGASPANWPPAADSARVEATILGPTPQPAWIASRKATSPLTPELPRPRTVVNPASRFSRAIATPSWARRVVPSWASVSSMFASSPICFE
jgi:hypothetical protein